MLTAKEKKAVLYHVASYRLDFPCNDGCVHALVSVDTPEIYEIDTEEEESMAYEGTVVNG